MPFTPTKPTQAQRTAYSITVTWQPTGNHSIDSYTLYYREKSASKWILVKDIRGRTSTTLDNLEPYTTYQFRVFAVNNIGLSKPSPLAEMTTLEKGMSLFKVFLFSVKFFWKGTGSREGFPQHDWYIYKRQMILTKKQSRRQFFSGYQTSSSRLAETLSPPRPLGERHVLLLCTIPTSDIKTMCMKFEL